jgi:uncharacterized membrane protein
MQMSPIIAIHMSAALAAIATGPVALWARQGSRQRPRLHRAFGYAWVTLMLATAISALFIRDHKLPNIDGYTPVHLLIPVVLLMLVGAFWKLAHGDVRGHATLMKRLYISACIVAGFFTLLPQRYLGTLLWAQVPNLEAIVRRTPSWAWLLLLALVVLGLMQMRERTQGLLRVSITPVAMVAFSLWAAVSAFGRSPVVTEALWLWMLGAAATAVLFAFAESSARYDAGTRTFRIPGSWVPLVLFIGIFLARYLVSVRLAIHPDLLLDTSFVLPVATLYGAFSGLFLGRASQLWRLPLRQSAVPQAA